MANVYYSIGQNTTDHKTGSPTCVIFDGVLIFSTDQTATNVGVGDRVTYDTTKICYLVSKVSKSKSAWNVVTKLGATPADVYSFTTVNSVAHEYTSMAAAIAGVTDANHLNTTNLVTGGYNLYLPCYYDTGVGTNAVNITGHTLGASNRIIVYTPYNTDTECNQSHRHAGKWTTAAYTLKTAATTSSSLIVNENFVNIIGLQFSVIGVAGNNYLGACIQLGTNATGANTGFVDSCLFRCEWLNRAGTFKPMAAIYQAGQGSPAVSNYRNCIIYDAWNDAGTAQGVGGTTNYCSQNLYNCTFHNCDTAVEGYANGTSVSKNVIAQDCNVACFAGTFSSSNNNISDDGTQPGTSGKNGTVTFINKASDDFHLSTSDTVAKAAGADLFSIFTNDIDNGIRGKIWDAGADQITPADVYYSVGQNATDHKTGSPSGSISNGMLSFSIAQTSDNIGVGDRITFSDGSIVYILEKLSLSVWKVITSRGTTPQNKTLASITSITHEYTSMISSLAGASDINHITSLNLIDTNANLNFPCYYDTGFDTTEFSISSYLTSSVNRIKFYTPCNILTECNKSQRHEAIWKPSGAFTHKTAYHNNQINITINHVDIIGLQCSNTGNASYSAACIGYQAGSFDANNTGKIMENIIRAEWTNRSVTNGTPAGISLGTAGSPPKHYIANNIFYDFYRDDGNGIAISNYNYSHAWIYNNTIYNCDTGLAGTTDGNISAKNNIVQDCLTACYGSNFYTAGCTNNCADDGTAPGANSISGTVILINKTAYNLLLSAYDLIAKSKGVNLYNDSNLPITVDILKTPRPSSGNFDLGANQLYARKWVSLGNLLKCVTFGINNFINRS